MTVLKMAILLSTSPMEKWCTLSCIPMDFITMTPRNENSWWFKVQTVMDMSKGYSEAKVVCKHKEAPKSTFTSSIQASFPLWSAPFEQICYLEVIEVQPHEDDWRQVVSHWPEMGSWGIAWGPQRMAVTNLSRQLQPHEESILNTVQHQLQPFFYLFWLVYMMLCRS